MMEPISEQRLQVCFPPLATATREADAWLQSVYGWGIRVAECDRSIAQSDADYAQGRTTPGKIITNAPGLHSWHNFDMAVDCYPFMSGNAGALDWTPTDDHFTKMISAMEAQGLVSGSTWCTIKDYPHFQPSTVPVSPTDADRAAYASGGTQAVWAQYMPTPTTGVTIY